MARLLLPALIFLSLRAAAAEPTDAWAERQPAPTALHHFSVAHGSAGFVAVGEQGRTMTSTDGISWQVRSSQVEQDLLKVASFSGQMLALGSAGALTASSDGGVTWQRRTTPLEPTWRDLTHTGTQFILVGEEGSISTSADAISWTHRSTGQLEALRAVQAGSGLVLAAGESGSIWKSSDDGATWTAATGSPTESLAGLAWTGSSWLACAHSGRMYGSATGDGWAALSSPGTVGSAVNSLRWDGAQLIATTESGSVATSTDGITWATASTGTGVAMHATASGAGIHLCVGAEGRIATSTDLASWTATHSGPLGHWRGVAHSGSTYVAVGPAGRISSSTDGISWVARSSGVSSDFNAVVWTGSSFVTVGTAGTCRRSLDGQTWSTSTTGTSTAELLSVQASGGVLVATAAGGIILRSTNDGLSWSGPSTPNAQRLMSAAQGSGIWVAVGTTGNIISSADGNAPWTARSIVGFTEELVAVAHSPTGFRVVGADGAVLSSANGISWSKVGTIQLEEGAIKPRALHWFGGEWVCIGALDKAGAVEGIIASSADGITFTRRSIGPTPPLRALSTGSTPCVVGERGFISTPTTVAQWASASSSVAEGAATLQLSVSIGTASAVSTQISLSTSGTATVGAGGDVTLSTTQLTIPAGSTTAQLSISFTDDFLDEPDETLTLTLQPSIGSAVAAASSITLTLLDDDFPPSFTSPPASQIVAAGATVSFAYTATGALPTSYQWLKNNSALPSASGTHTTVLQGNYDVTTASLADAGSYQVRLTNASGTATSTAAQLAVVDATASAVSVPRGKSLSLNASAAGTGITYQWEKDSVPLTNSARIQGATAPWLTVLGMDTADAGAYRCMVSQPGGGQQPAGVRSVTVLLPPIISTASFPGLLVGESAAVQLSASPAATQWIVSGLPRGLVASSSGSITGKPLAAGTYTVKLLASNAAGSSATLFLPWTVAPLSTPLSTAHTGSISRDATLTLGLGGRINLSLSSTAAASGTVALGTQVYPFTGQLQVSSATAATLTTLIRRSSLPPLTLSLVLDGTTGTSAGSLTDGSATTTVETQRLMAAPFTALAGYYTCALKLPPGDVGDTSLPQGHGYGSFTLGSTGVASGTLYLADRAVVPLSAALRADGSLILYQPLYAGLGSVLGKLVLTAGSPALVSSADLSWSKTAQPAPNRSYTAGWASHGPISLSATGSRYTPPSTGSIILNLTASADNVPNASLLFTEGHAPSPASRLDTSLRYSSPALRDPQTPLSGTNPGRVNLVIQASNGLLSGSFSLTDTDTSATPSAPLTRTSYFYGALTRDADGQLRGLGHFNLAEMPSGIGPTRITATPIHSGSVTLQASP